MVSVLEEINPIYLFVAGGVFMIILGCACYGFHDMLYSHAELAAGIVACDASDCDIQDIHEQHCIDKGEGLWSTKAWGMESEDCSAGIGNTGTVAGNNIGSNSGDGEGGHGCEGQVSVSTGVCPGAVDIGAFGFGI